MPREPTSPVLGAVVAAPSQPPLYWELWLLPSEMQKINLSEVLAKELVFSLLRARQCWVLRQDDLRSVTTTIKSHFIAGLHRLLQRFEEKEKDPGKPTSPVSVSLWTMTTKKHTIKSYTTTRSFSPTKTRSLSPTKTRSLSPTKTRSLSPTRDFNMPADISSTSC
ncbi:hypothetical protein J3F84DRAFT_353268 [Trichoderma pleuroticola]